MRKRSYFTLFLTLFLIIALSVEYYYERGGDFLSVSSSMNGKESPINRVETPKKQIALSFDAGFRNRNTETILAVLEKHQVKATFFLTGDFVTSSPELVKEIAEQGHELGNHTNDHISLWKSKEDVCQAQIMELHQKVKTLTGEDMTLFHPPYGEYHSDLLKIARANGYKTIHYSINAEDWKDISKEEIIHKVCNDSNLTKGDIIQFYSSGKHTPEALDTLLNQLTIEGYEIVPISQLLSF